MNLFSEESLFNKTARDYQTRAITATFDAWGKHRSLIGVMPTGGGKTFCFANIVKQSQPCRTLILAHMNELVDQIHRALREVNIEAEVEKADRYANALFWKASPTVIATPQTLYANNHSRLKKWKPEEFDLLIIDELHHYVAPAYQKIVKYLQQNPKLKTLGVTATPDRTDNLSLKAIVDDIAFNVEIIDLINEGWLVRPVQAFALLKEYDLSGCHKSGEDFNSRELSDLLEQNKITLAMADEIIRQCATKRSLIFCESVKQAENIATVLNNYRDGIADCVFGHTPEDRRKATFEAFANGDVQMLVNVAVCTEAYDNPAIEAIVMCKPTLSRIRYCQMLGRGLRTLPGIVDGADNAEDRRTAIAASEKPEAFVLDFVGNSGRHKLISCTDILGGHFSEEAKVKAKKEAEKAGRADVLSLLQRAEIELRKEEAQRKLKGLRVNARYDLHYIEMFEAFRQNAQKWSGHKQKFLAAKQRARLIQKGWNPDEHSLVENLAKHRELIMASPAQIGFLRSMGTPSEVLNNCARWDASKFIKLCIENGKRWPREQSTH